jgi:hypothetical protein
MAARLADATDVTTYAAFGVQLNDLIDDTNEAVDVRQSYHNMPVDFPSFRAGGTIWLLNTPEGSRYGHRFTGIGTLWGGGSSSNPVNVKLLNQNFWTKDPRNTNAYLLSIDDCQYIKLSGYHPDNKGMRDSGFNGRPELFFGAQMNKNGFYGDSTNMLAVGGDLKQITIEDWYVKDGFAKFRIIPNNTSVLDKVFIHRCWGEYGNGEALYLNKTNATGGATPLASNWHVADSVAFMTGAEGFQLQDLMQGTNYNLIENCVLVYNASDWKAPFLSAQGSAFQLRYNEGKIIVRNCIIYGWGNTGLNLQFNTLGNPAVNNGQMVYDNCLFIDGRNRCVLLNTNDTNIPIVMSRCDFGHIEEEYASIGSTQALEQINIFNLIDFTVKNSRYSSNRTFYIEEDPGDGANTKDVNNTSVSDSAIERPAFINIGLGDAKDILNWNWETSNGTAAPGTPIDFTAGDVVRFKIMEEVFTVDTSTDEIIKTAHGYSNGDLFTAIHTSGTLPAPLSGATLYYVVEKTDNRFKLSETSGGGAVDITTTGTGTHKFAIRNSVFYGRFYKALTTHSSTEATRPDRDATNWVLLTWDESGVRSDAVGWASGDTQSYEPPKDIRLVAGSQHEVGGRRKGLSFGPTNYTQYQWQESLDGGTTWDDIYLPAARLSYFNYSEFGYQVSGKSFRRKIIDPVLGTSVGTKIDIA